MPFTIDVHENEFLEEIYQDGVERGIVQGLEKGRREAAGDLLIGLAEAKFGVLPPSIEDRLLSATLPELNRWSRRLLSAARVDELFD